ncbi:MAG: hypothetical protein J6T92_04930 [Ottowia sp.]|nr:hypothetical protein [Ottowia sp.]
MLMSVLEKFGLELTPLPRFVRRHVGRTARHSSSGSETKRKTHTFHAAPRAAPAALHCLGHQPLADNAKH